MLSGYNEMKSKLIASHLCLKFFNVHYGLLSHDHNCEIFATSKRGNLVKEKDGIEGIEIIFYDEANEHNDKYFFPSIFCARLLLKNYTFSVCL